MGSFLRQKSLTGLVVHWKSCLQLHSGPRVCFGFAPATGRRQLLMSLGCCPQSERDALLYGCCKVQAVVDRQRLLIRGVAGVCAVYQWRSPSWRYTGFGKTVRESLPLQGGLSHRLLEHLYGTLRPDSAEAYKVRYRLARRTWPTGSFFLLATHGPEAMMRAVCIDIVTHRPMSNGAPRIAKPGKMSSQVTATTHSALKTT